MEEKDEITGDQSYWHIIFDGEDPGPSDDFALEFMDCSFLVGEPLLKNDFLEDLISLVKKHEQYNIIGNIKKINDDLGENQTDKNIYALLGIMNNGLRIGFLLGNVIDGEINYWHVAALWPEEFALNVIKDQDLFKLALMSFLEKPDEWARVDLIIPISKKNQPTMMNI
ncbi:MAG: hypothetical protein ACFFCS_11315 [Candidatus Hodarchaeota archaeon]